MPETAVMKVAKNKAKSPKGRTTKDREQRSLALQVRGTEAWKAWVEGGAAFCRTDVAKLVDAALIEYLQAKGYKEVPPER
jgi:hypothetical protein